MSEEEARRAGEEDARYLWKLLEEGVPLEVAVRLACTRILARLLAEADRPPKEPWQQ